MAITANLFIAVAVHGRSCTIRLGGVLDGATAHRVADLGRTVAGAEACDVTIDLSELDLVDVAGWHALRGLTADLTERGVIVTQLGARSSYDRLDGVLVGLDACRRRPTRLACSAPC
jgi:anti-anti-sigma regulatory factor